MQDAATQLNRGVISNDHNNRTDKQSENNESRPFPKASGAIVNINDSELSELTLEMPEESGNSSESSDYIETEELEYHEYRHVRSPELRRSEQVLLMTASAVCGAIGGVILALSDKYDPKALQELIDASLSGFGSIFFQRILIGALFLGIEYLLGFFALGDLLVWASPLVYSLGTAFRITVLKSWVLIPSAVVGAAAIIFGAALSAGFSRSLMRLSSGGTVYLESSPKQKLTINFLGCLAAVIAAAIYEGAIL